MEHKFQYISGYFSNHTMHIFISAFHLLTMWTLFRVCLLTGGTGKNSKKAKSVVCKPIRHYYTELNVMSPFSSVFPGALVTVPPNLLM